MNDEPQAAGGSPEAEEIWRAILLGTNRRYARELVPS